MQSFTQKIRLKVSRLRQLIVESLLPRESHHIGCSLSILDIVTVLYYSILRTNPKKPSDPDRDIFILSKGHGALAVYAVLYEKGFFSKDILMSYDRDGGKLPEHITHNISGVEVSTGSLGHGLPIGSGFALSFKNDRKDNKVYVLMSDGELNEGSNWESIMFAAHHKLSNLIAIIDLNGYQGYSTTEKVLDLSPLSEKFQSFGWNVHTVDGHNYEDMRLLFQKIQSETNTKPNVVIARTVKGKGIPFFEGKFESHYLSIDEETKKTILTQLQRN